MTNYSISFKIKDYNPKINSISYKDYICLLINGGFQIRIPIINEEYSNIKHEVKNIKSDLYYKITLLDNKIKTFISISDFCIPYKILLKIKQDSPFIYEKEIKFSIGMKKNFKVFSSLNKIGNISLIISTKILKNPKKIANKNKTDLIRNYLVKGNILPISFTQRNQKNRNLLKNKVEIKKKNKNKEKDDFFYSDSNRHISTNDLSGNHFNTFSMNDDTENNNTNNSIANIVSHKNYYFNTTLGNDETKKLNNINVIDNGNENGNLFEYKLKNANIDNEVSNLLEKRKNIRKKFYFSKGIFIKNKLSQNITQNIMKNKIKNENKNKKKKNINKFKTRNSFNSYKIRKNENNLGNEDEERNSMSCNKKKVIKFVNEDNITFHSCESYKNKKYLSTGSKKIKNRFIATSFTHKNKIDKNKIISLSKDKYDKLLKNKKKKYISENILNKALLSERISRSQNTNEKSNSNYKKKKIFNKNINKNKKKKINLIIKKNVSNHNHIIVHNISNEILNNSSSPNINKVSLTSYNKFYINNLSNSDIEIKIDDNNFSANFIKVNKKLKNIKYSNNNYINYEQNQKELKNYAIKLSEYFILNNKNIKTIYLKLKEKINKLKNTKEIFFTSLKKLNRLQEKKSKISINHIINYNINNKLNQKIKLHLLQVKKEEFSTYQKIFNFSYLDEEIIKYKENEKIILQKIVNLQLNIIKNMIEHYGNISQIYTNDIVKKEKLKKILIKNNIIEKENKNNIIDLVSLNKINTCVKKIIKNTFNNDVYYQFNIIKEVQEEKESEKISNNRSSSNIVTNSKNSLMNDAPDEILFIDKKESDNEEDLNISKKKRYSISNIKIENDLKNNYFYNKEKKSNSKSLDKIKKEEQKDKGKNMKKELIGINKKKFKGKNLNIEEIDIDFNINKKKKKDNFRKNEYFNKRKK